jgi:hypothetical protein
MLQGFSADTIILWTARKPSFNGGFAELVCAVLLILFELLDAFGPKRLLIFWRCNAWCCDGDLYS